MPRWTFQRRLVVGVGGVGAICLVTMLVVMIARSRSLARDQAEDYAQAVGEAKAREATGVIELAFQSANDFASVVAAVADEPDGRDRAVGTLVAVLEANPMLLGTWTAWDPDAYDGQDATASGQGVTTDDTGRFVPYAYRTAAGVEVTPLVDYDQPGLGDYYLLAHDSGRPQLLDPYVYPVDGVDVLMTSVAVPMTVDGETVGVSGVDLALDSLQQIVNDVTIYQSGTASLYTAGGTVVAHHDPALVTTAATGPAQELIAAAVESGEPARVATGGQLLVAVPVELGGAALWVMLIEVPQSEVLADVRQLSSLGLILAVTGVVVIVGAGWFLARRLGRSLAHQAATIDTVAADLARSTTHIDREAAQVSDRATEVSSSSALVSQRVDTVASAVAEMTTATGMIVDKTRHAIEVAESARVTVEATERTIDRLGQSSQSIDAVVDLISAIAGQTNLLALNATIEAARAGTAGKGFAVVADEVKELARQTTQATGTITSRIAQIRQEADGAVTAIAGVAGVMAEITEIQRTISEAVAQQESLAEAIATSASEAAVGSSQIAGAAADLARGARNSRQLASALSTQSQDLTTVAGELSVVIGSSAADPAS